MMADQITFKPSDIQPAVSTPWNPGPNDTVAEIQTSDGGHHLIHSDDLAEAQRRDPKITVLGQPQAYRDYAKLPVSPNVTFSTLDIDKVATQKNQAQAASAAEKRGAYQQSKEQAQAHIVHNVNEEAANPFSDATTSVLGSTGALMKREDETDLQFMARAREAGRNVSQTQIDAETASTKRLAAPTAGIAAAAGPAMLSLESAAGSVFDYAAEKLGLSAGEDMGLREWVEQMGQKMPTVLDKATGAAKTAIQWIWENPLRAYVISQIARELGVPLGKLLHLASGRE